MQIAVRAVDHRSVAQNCVRSKVLVSSCLFDILHLSLRRFPDPHSSGRRVHELRNTKSHVLGPASTVVCSMHVHESYIQSCPQTAWRTEVLEWTQHCFFWGSIRWRDIIIWDIHRSFFWSYIAASGVQRVNTFLSWYTVTLGIFCFWESSLTMSDV